MKAPQDTTAARRQAARHMNPDLRELKTCGWTLFREIGSPKCELRMDHAGPCENNENTRKLKAWLENHPDMLRIESNLGILRRERDTPR